MPKVGWLELPNSNRATFTEYTDSFGNLHHAEYAAKSVGSFYTYEVSDSLVGWWAFYVDGSQLGPVVDPGWTPIGAQVEAETHTSADQMPGGSDYLEYFSGTYAFYNGVWNNYAGVGVNPYPSWYTLYGYSTTNFATRDNAC